MISSHTVCVWPSIWILTGPWLTLHFCNVAPSKGLGDINVGGTPIMTPDGAHKYDEFNRKLKKPTQFLITIVDSTRLSSNLVRAFSWRRFCSSIWGKWCFLSNPMLLKKSSSFEVFSSSSFFNSLTSSFSAPGSSEKDIRSSDFWRGNVNEIPRYKAYRQSETMSSFL